MKNPQLISYSIVKAESFSFKISSKSNMLPLLLLFKIVLEILATEIRQEKERKGIQIGKGEVKLSLFAEDMILFIENPKDFTPKLLELINSIRSQNTKIKIQKYLVLLYTNSKLSEIEIKKIIPFTIASKRIKYLGIKFNERGENYTLKIIKIPMKEIREDLNVHQWMNV